LVTEPRQTCVSVAWAHTCVSELCKVFVSVDNFTVSQSMQGT